MKKTVKAVAPYIYTGQINFKHKPYNAWVELGGQTAESHYPSRFLHGVVYKYDFPQICKSKKEARLRFVQPYSMSFDTFPDYILYEIIPFFWDVWPDVFDQTIEWLKRHDVKTAFFTSSQVAEKVREMFPKMNVMWCPEGIDVDNYKQGKELKDRNIDYLLYGRPINNIVEYDTTRINCLYGWKSNKIVFSNQELIENLSNSKVVAAYPKSVTHPKRAGNVETLTQRFWECMLSRCVMIGYAPKELIKLLGYNPVIEIDMNNPNMQLREVIDNIEDYQQLVDKNHKMAFYYGDWKYGMKKVMEFLQNFGYTIL